MDPFLGQIQPFGFNFAPRGWAFCNGQLLPISSNTALFSLLGITYGGNVQTAFALPDLRGRSIIHPGQGAGLSSINWGEMAGQENVTLNVNNLPSHTHTGNVRLGNGLANTSSGTGKNFAANTGGTSIYNSGSLADNMDANVVINNSGGSIPFNNRNPFLGIYVSIALEGIYPSRS